MTEGANVELPQAVESAVTKPTAGNESKPVGESRQPQATEDPALQQQVDEEQAARIKEMLAQANLIDREEPTLPPQIQPAPEAKIRPSFFILLKNGIVNLLHLLTLNIFRKK